MKLTGLINTTPKLFPPKILNKYQNKAFNEIKADVHIGQKTNQGTIIGRYGNRWIVRNERTGLSKFVNGSSF